MKTPLFFFLVLLLAAGCKEGRDSQNTNGKSGPLPQLVETYRQGEVLKCAHEGKTVYKCSRNAPDAGAEIFDAEGKKIGGCYWFTGDVDPICEALTGCEAIHRVHPNIWGKPGVEYRE